MKIDHIYTIISPVSGFLFFLSGLIFYSSILGLKIKSVRKKRKEEREHIEQMRLAGMEKAFLEWKVANEKRFETLKKFTFNTDEGLNLKIKEINHLRLFREETGIDFKEKEVDNSWYFLLGHVERTTPFNSSTIRINNLAYLFSRLTLTEHKY